MNRNLVAIAAGSTAVILCALAWRMHPAAFLAAYLAAWWFWIGIALGGLANVWLHNLTGGAWGEAIRAPLLEIGRSTWIAALLFLPLLAGMHSLYPWAAQAGDGAFRWAGELAAPGFKDVWLTPGFFLARSVAYLALWSVLALLAQRPALRRSKPFSALALILYGFSVSLAAVDWIMSLIPVWYSSVFGWLAGTGQMLAGMALATVLAARARPPVVPGILRDLGNLLLMYVMTWAYLGFTQFLIIWAENLPHEIAWYLPRLQGGWLVMAWMLTLCLFAAPLLLLLSRQAKQSPRVMGALAAALLVMQLIDCWWLILPSVPVPGAVWFWIAPLALAGLGIAAWLLWPYRSLSLKPPQANGAQHG
ncbi:MAG TPA: hypothetical protein VJ603_06475 [Paucimonas sp.]|nr:hypothetical protein [Paucimonas sp.]HJW57723.1 hypothetical protein [Burkholderiaceae bacterium]